MLGVQRSTWRRKKKCRPGGLVWEMDKDDNVMVYSSLALLMAVFDFIFGHQHHWLSISLLVSKAG